MPKTYLGDSVYVDYDGEYIVLTTENYATPSNIIYLDTHVYLSLLDYVERMKKLREEELERNK
jgi:hypothetical protein